MSLITFDLDRTNGTNGTKGKSGPENSWSQPLAVGPICALPHPQEGGHGR